MGEWSSVVEDGGTKGEGVETRDWERNQFTSRKRGPPDLQD